MNDIFNLKRFMRYAMLNYSRKRLDIIMPALSTAFLIIIMLIEINAGVEDRFSSLDAAKKNVTISFITTFLVMGIVFLTAFTRVTISGLKRFKRFTMSDLLIPVSSTERYIFAVVNSLIIAPAIYILLFSLISSYAETLYFFPTDGQTASIIYRGMFTVGETVTPAGYENIDIFNFSTLVDTFAISPEENLNLPILSAYILGVSMLMWGGVTFAKNGTMYAILLHLAIVVLISLATIYILKDTIDLVVVATNNINNGLDVNYSYSLGATPIWATLISLSVIYQVITFLKIKTLSVKH